MYIKKRNVLLVTALSLLSISSYAQRNSYSENCPVIPTGSYACVTDHAPGDIENARDSFYITSFKKNNSQHYQFKMSPRSVLYLGQEIITDKKERALSVLNQTGTGAAFYCKNNSLVGDDQLRTENTLLVHGFEITATDFGFQSKLTGRFAHFNSDSVVDEDVNWVSTMKCHKQ